MKISRFNNYNINESCKAASLTGEVTLYRLTSHDVVDLAAPGEYYVCDEADINPSLLKKQDGDLYLITVKCDSSNINVDESEKECAKHESECIVAVNDDKSCEIITVEPYLGNHFNKTNEIYGQGSAMDMMRNNDSAARRDRRVEKTKEKEELIDYLESNIKSNERDIFDNNDRLVLMSDVIDVVYEFIHGKK